MIEIEIKTEDILKLYNDLKKENIEAISKWETCQNLLALGVPIEEDMEKLLKKVRSTQKNLNKVSQKYRKILNEN